MVKALRAPGRALAECPTQRPIARVCGQRSVGGGEGASVAAGNRARHEVCRLVFVQRSADCGGYARPLLRREEGREASRNKDMVSLKDCRHLRDGGTFPLRRAHNNRGHVRAYL